MIVVYKDKAGVDKMTPVPYENEAELQLVLKEHPELLQEAGDARLYCIGREVCIGEAGKVDLLFVDDDGKPTVVEVKLARNGESRRDVLAQVFDYTASLADYTIDELDRQLENELENQLQALAGEGDDARAKYNRLWEACANAMRVGSVRVVVAMDEPREDLERIVRFVNEHSDLDVRLLVVRKYTSGGKTVFVPELIVHGGGAEVSRLRARRSGADKSPQAFVVIREMLADKLKGDVTLGERGSGYQKLVVPGLPEDTYYELHWSDRRANPSFHIETARAKYLATVLQRMAKTLKPKFPQGEVIWDSNWWDGLGRLYIRPPKDTPPEEVVELMLAFVEATRAEIAAAVADHEKPK